MNRKLFVAFAVSAAFLVSCAREIMVNEPDQEPAGIAGTSSEPSYYVQGEAIIYISEELNNLVEKDLADGRIITKSDGLNDIVSSLGVTSMTRLFPDAGEFEPRTRKEGLHRWYKVTYGATKATTKAMEFMSEVAGIEKVEPVMKITLDKFNDPALSKQWHYINKGGGAFKVGCDINVQPVWDNFTKGDPSVIVSVVDGGIDYSHEDLAWNYVGGFNYVRNSSYIVPHSHGTHVAGTIGAVNNNSTGCCGIAGGDYLAGQKGVGLYSCQVFEPVSGADDKTGDFSRAIKEGADRGAVISQNSWGYSFKTYAEAEAAAKMGLASFSGSTKAAIDYFIKYAGCDNSGNQLPNSPMKGGVYISSAGNSNWDRDVIGEYAPVIAVGAVSPAFTRASYSNYGSWVDICAPGGDAAYSNGMVWSTVPGGYAFMQGTSMACPHVSGVAALIVSHFGRKGFTNTMLTERLLDGANAGAIPAGMRIGPLVDAMGSITLGGDTPPAKIKDFSTSVKSNFITIEWQVTEDVYGTKAYGTMIAASTDKALLEGMDPTKVPAGVSVANITTGSKSAGETMSGAIGDLKFDTEYHVALFAYNYNNCYSAISPVKSVVTGSNSAPVIVPVDPHDVVLKSFQSETLKFMVSDPDGHDINVTLETGSKAAKGSLKEDGTYELAINGPAGDPGDFIADITVTDKFGAKSSYKQKFKILENQSPVIVKDKSDVLLVRIGQRTSLDLLEHMSDPDGEDLQFSVDVSNANNLKVEITGSKVELRALNYGETTVTCRGADAKGKACLLKFKVLALDQEIPMDVYPNPVVNNLYIRVHQPSQVTYCIVSASGSKVVDETCDATPFSPIVVDFTALAPGRYTLSAFFNGEDHKMNIIKL